MFYQVERRTDHAYQSWRAQVMAERPICEHCNKRPSERLAHIEQPILGHPLMDRRNVLALCKPCDRDFTRFNPPLRRRKLRSPRL